MICMFVLCVLDLYIAQCEGFERRPLKRTAWIIRPPLALNEERLEKSEAGFAIRRESRRDPAS